MSSLRLGVNVDHVATLRQARYSTMLESKNAEPDPLVAARLCERAGRGEILVSDAVWERMAGAFVAEPQEPIRVKGFDRDLVTYRVTGAIVPETGQAQPAPA
jgi:hypothetical protein